MKAEPASRSGGRGVGANPGRAGGGPGGGGTGEEERPNNIAYKNAYMKGRWGIFRHAGAMRLITQKVILAGVDLPLSPIDPKCKAFPTFYIKGMCNTGCGNVTDHVAHTWEQDCTMPIMWLGKCVCVVLVVNIMIHS